MQINPMKQTIALGKPRLEHGRPMMIAGLRGHITEDPGAEIPRQWQRFSRYLGRIPDQASDDTFGVCFPLSAQSCGFDYLSGVEVFRTTGLPEEFSMAMIPAHRYAIVPHEGHVSELRETVHAIYDRWLPENGYEPARSEADEPLFFERYGVNFSAQTGRGDIEVWVPIKG